MLAVPEGVHPLALHPDRLPRGAERGDTGPGDGRKSPDEIIAYNEYPW